MIKKGALPVIIENPRNQHTLLRSILIVLVYLILFILLDFITKQFDILPGVVSWYPPAGLTYALLLVFGVKFTPAVILALFLSSVFIYRMPQPPFLLFLWSFIVSLIYVATAWFLRHRIHLDWQLRKLRDVTWLVFTAVFVSALLAVLSVSSSALSSALPRSEVPLAIFHWWIGESVGVLTVTPFLLLYVMPLLKRIADGESVHLPKPFSFPKPALNTIGQSFSLAFVLYLVFGVHVLNDFHPMFLIALPIIWIALDHGLKGISASILVLNFGVVLSTWLFGFDLARLTELELLMIVICIIGLLMGATVIDRKQTEEALRESEKEFHILAEVMPQIVWITRPDGWNIYFNEQWVDYTGLTLEESYGHGWNKPFHPDDQHRAWDAWQNATNNGAVYSLECRLRRKDGVYKWWLIRGVPVLDAEGTILKWFGTCTDIDEIKQSENEIKTQLDELQRWHAATLGRENRILELKHEVNELLSVTQQSPRYPSAESQDEEEN